MKVFGLAISVNPDVVVGSTQVILKIDTAAISFADTRSDQNILLSVLRELDEIRLVVVRRAPMTQDLVPIGIRGPERFQR